MEDLKSACAAYRDGEITCEELHHQVVMIIAGWPMAKDGGSTVQMDQFARTIVRYAELEVNDPWEPKARAQ